MRAGIALALVLALNVVGAAAGLSFDRTWETTMPDAVLDLAVSDDGGMIVVLTEASLCCFDADGALRWEVPGRHAQNVGISGDGSLVVTGGEDLQAYDRNGETVFRHETGYFAFGTGVSRDGTCIAAGFDNSSLFVFRKNSTGLFEQAAVVGTDEDVVAVALSQSGDEIVTGEKDGAIRYYTGEGRLLWSYDTGSTTFFESMSDDGGYVAVGADHGVAELLNRNGRVLWEQFSGERRPGVGITADGSLFALGGNGIRFFARNGSELGAIGGGEVASLAVAGNGSMVAAGAGRTVTLYRPASGTAAEDTAVTSTPTVALTNAEGKEQPTPAQSASPITTVAAAAAIMTFLNRIKRG